MKIGYLKKQGKKMSNKQFKKKLEKGEDVERRFVKYLQKKYPKTYKIEGNNKDGDIFVPEANKMIEVKNDKGSTDTPNYFIEFSCNGEKSGIAATKSDFWFIYDEFNCMWVNTPKLKTLCKDFGRYWKGIPEKENCSIEAFLVPQNVIKDNADLIRKGEVYGL